MRIVDTSGPGPGPEAEVRVVPAAELVMATTLVLAGDGSRDFDLPPERLADLRASVSPQLADDLRALSGSSDEQLLNLVRFAVASDPPHDAPAFLDALRAADPEDIVLHMLWVQGQSHVSDDTVRRAVAGDADARAALVDPMEDEKCTEVERILDLGPERAHELVIDAFERFADEVWPAIEDEAVHALERDAEAKRRLLQDEPTLSAIEAATNGYRLPTDPDLRRVVMVPSYLFRPWLLTLEPVDGEQVLIYPVADENIELDPDRPSPQLLRMVKALSDEGRLRLVRRLTAEDLSLSEAAETMGVSKPTAHHHLALLRQAGLISVIPRGREMSYSLRSKPAEYAGQLLARYLDT